MIRLEVKYSLGQYKDEEFTATITCIDSDLPEGKYIFGYGGEDEVRIYPLSRAGLQSAKAKSLPYNLWHISKGFPFLALAKQWVESIAQDIAAQVMDYEHTLGGAVLPEPSERTISTGELSVEIVE